MDKLLTPVFQYCERQAVGLWGEPLGFTSNLAFLISAFFVWRLNQKEPARALRTMAVIAALIGLGSGLFHSWPNRISQIADITPISFFAFYFILAFFTMQARLGEKWKKSLAICIALVFVPVALIYGSGWKPHTAGGAFYAGLPFAISFLAFQRKEKDFRKHMLMAAGTFLCAYTARTVDPILCSQWPHGTHFIWHLLNSGVIYLLAVSFSDLLRVAPSGIYRR